MDLQGCPCGGTPNILDTDPTVIRCGTCGVFIHSDPAKERDGSETPTVGAVWNRMVARHGTLADCCKAVTAARVGQSGVVAKCSTCRRRFVPFGIKPPDVDAAALAGG